MGRTCEEDRSGQIAGAATTGEGVWQIDKVMAGMTVEELKDAEERGVPVLFDCSWQI